MALLFIHLALARGIQSETMSVTTSRRRGCPLELDLTSHLFRLADVVRIDCVHVRQTAHDEHVAEYAHRHQEHRPDCRETKNTSQHDFPSSNRFGHNRVNRAILNIRRQAEGA